LKECVCAFLPVFFFWGGRLSVQKAFSTSAEAADARAAWAADTRVVAWDEANADAVPGPYRP
jgi:hypothetical protein